MTVCAAIATPGHSSRLNGLAGSREQSLPSVVVPFRAAEISAHVAGDVVELFVEEGGEVQAGEPVARIDDRIPRAQLDVARMAAGCEANINLAESELRQARRHRDRILAAVALHAVSKADADVAISGFELAEARLSQAREQSAHKLTLLDLEQARLNAHLMTAPFDGNVLRISQEVGSAVQRGTAVVRIADISRLKAVVFVPFEWFDVVHAGQYVQISAGAPVNRLLEAEIVSVEPVIDAATETFRCVVEIDNTDRRLPSGFSVQLEQQYVIHAELADKRQVPVR